MAVFDFPYHVTPEIEYPESGVRIQFGNNYTSTAEPDTPDARKFTLSYRGFQYYVDNAGVVDLTTNANINNMATLEAFYTTHRLWKSFIFPHPVYGNIECKFSKPLKVPKGIPGKLGELEGFTVELIEQP
ncbi:hypothetical protein [Kiloniella sp.]|uniref:hypothetical protein n=1 Tax=Kiloniella sp. TaxID=1938587 RepID=UPI003B022AF8